jgi:hypothetical protein
MQPRSTSGWPVDRSVQARNAAQRLQRLAARRACRQARPGRQNALARWLLGWSDHGARLPYTHTAGQNATDA